ncbi:MAG: uracil-DNA glycosylase family protein [Gaiellaceae bacterium]
MLSQDLAVVFVGTEPGRLSIQTGCYYANPANAFYRQLAETGFTPSQVAPSEFQRLLEYGVGLDDVYDDADALRARIESMSPRAVCFNSKEALRRFAGVRQLRPPWRREEARRYADLGELTWALTDSSWEASRYWPDRCDDLFALRRVLYYA